jgi:hypothetical protein
MQLVLDNSQSHLLRELLDDAWLDLRCEIGNIREAKYREPLQERQRILLAILDQLEGRPVARSA